MSRQQEPRQVPRLPGSARPRSGPQTGTWVALSGLSIVALGLLALASTVLPGFVLFLGVIGFFSLMFGGQYLLWGYWLDRSLSKQGRGKQTDFWSNVQVSGQESGQDNSVR